MAHMKEIKLDVLQKKEEVTLGRVGFISYLAGLNCK